MNSSVRKPAGFSEEAATFRTNELPEDVHDYNISRRRGSEMPKFLTLDLCLNTSPCLTFIFLSSVSDSLRDFYWTRQHLY